MYNFQDTTYESIDDAITDQLVGLTEAELEQRYWVVWDYLFLRYIDGLYYHEDDAQDIEDQCELVEETTEKYPE